MSKRIITTILVVALAGATAWFCQTPTVRAAGSFSLSPAGGTYTADSVFTINLLANTAGQAVNAGEAVITFPADKLEVVNISQNGSIFTLWPTPPAAASGQISFAGGVASPGWSGNSGLLLSITFRAKRAGQATVGVSSGQLLLNDGSGTKMTPGLGRAEFTLLGGVPVAPVINSDTHPEETRWYVSSDPRFFWDQAEDVTAFSYIIDDQAETVPDDTSEGTDTSIQYQAQGEGSWYFHLKAKNKAGWSATSHRRVQVDHTVPDDFRVSLNSDPFTKDQTPDIYFRASDAVSGVDYYEVFLDNHLIERVPGDAMTMPWVAPRLGYGQHRAVIRAYDYAGNATESALDFKVVRFYPGAGFQLGEVYILYSWVLWPLLAALAVWGVIRLLLIIRSYHRCLRDEQALRSERSNTGNIKDKPTGPVPPAGSSPGGSPPPGERV